MLKVIFYFLFASFFASKAMALSSDVILTVKGNIGVFNDKKGEVYHFTEGDFNKIAQYNIVTKTTWTPMSTFTGPLITDVLLMVKAKGTKIEVVTYDDYKITLPISDFYRYHSIFARYLNGKPLQRRDYGPLWIMYPISSFSELQTVKADAKLVWQVKNITVY
ncbi:oxidoreductase [Chromobacterium violaceum]|uniref:oxidoreductase n=1 Tax=Chromobacterium violaceum TaxID=536 RepID=UPI000B15FB31|nr:oxidoreductase [Chromobacterium violaceum]